MAILVQARSIDEVCCPGGYDQCVKSSEMKRNAKYKMCALNGQTYWDYELECAKVCGISNGKIPFLICNYYCNYFLNICTARLLCLKFKQMLENSSNSSNCLNFQAKQPGLIAFNFVCLNGITLSLYHFRILIDYMSLKLTLC